MIIPFISVKNGLEAIELYKQVFDAEVVQEITMLYQVPGFDKPEYKDKIGHSTLLIKGTTLFLNDIIDSHPLVEGENIQFVLDLETEDNLRITFDMLSKEGTVIEELHEVFWGALFGSVKDKFNITWQLYYGHK